MYQTIVCAIGNGPRETAERILNKAAGLLDKDGSIFVVHAVETVPHYMTTSLPEDFETAAIKDAEDKLTLLCRQMKIPALVEVHTGSAARVLLAAAREKQADLIILSTHVADITDYIFGAVVDRVVRHAKCSVLIDRKQSPGHKLRGAVETVARC
ncbi:MAG: universal stress protein [Rhizobium sp.]|jgi:nucleotide-binding universal stress UspA family protein